jgi:anhydro-N-acetylmuramic acid kinase
MRLIGLMSGTSADGIDAALVRIERRDERPRVEPEAFVCMPWPDAVREAILNACRPDAPLQEITVLNFRLGELFAEAAQAVAEAAGAVIETVDAIASHGQTVWHQPTPIAGAGALTAGTLQIGEPSVIAARTGRLVVADFRCADMALGGQGAPLVPFADFHLFSDRRETRAVQNLGGIANVTLLTAGGTIDDVIAFDTGPGNVLLDALTQRLTAGALAFDVAGAIAAAGQVRTPLLDACLADPYFALPPPKSTGRERFGADYADAFLRRAMAAGYTIEDTLATATALTACSVADAYERWLLPRGPIATVILGGGGVHNATLVRMLTARLAPARLTTHRAYGVSDDAKEAIAFALMGYATLCGEPSNVPSATGASRSAVLGKIVLPPSGARFPQI